MCIRDRTQTRHQQGKGETSLHPLEGVQHSACLLYTSIKSTTKGLEVNKKGGIIVNEDGLTSRQGVYAGGDAVTGAATVILAMGAGKLGAKSIDEYLSNK